MKAAVFLAPKSIEIQDRNIPSINNDEILVKVVASGICGTDVKIYNGGKKVETPKIIGHEFSGVVFETGKNVKGLSCGDRVAVEPIIPCGSCYSCRGGRLNLCLSRPTIGYEYDGAFAEYVRIPATAIKAGNVVKLPEEVSFEEGALAEPVAACINGNKKLRQEKGSMLWIIGDGPIGLIHIQLSKLIGIEKIILSGTDDEKLLTGRNLGADYTINVLKEDVKEKISDITKGEGVSQVIIGANSVKTVTEAISLIKKGGVLIIFAGFSPDSKTTIDLNTVHYREISILGSSGHSVKELREAIFLMRDKKLNVNPLITHRFSIDEVVEGIKLKEEQKGIKHIIIMDK
ncbi:MAG: hypothetical protein A2W05_02565 [Candidatus Schekmanbacteria bacterium RBG_16_38_10]|uniref:Enoyl reductase (ER) domain-containing protein n=1 Tax=Candidatus Schekmanbacteria bacterium RBG_16_38_10 TaxID=1817879 RepID=A0A1F7RLZ7_9BACT|nr:MAG: hypothetical protein A2W05_02565 [Candidatus Schekmanbacteria bacterium RBG_16_38_10]